MSPTTNFILTETCQTLSGSNVHNYYLTYSKVNQYVPLTCMHLTTGTLTVCIMHPSHKEHKIWIQMSNLHLPKCPKM